MKTLERVVRPEHGFTLIEMMVALAILAAAVGVGSSMLLVMLDGAKHSGGLGERSQVLRSAINQIADDLAYAETDGHPTTPQCCDGGGAQFSVYVHQSRTNSTAWHSDWTTTERWPGLLTVARTFRVTYRIQGGNLIRIVHDPGVPELVRVYSYQVLAAGLDESLSSFTVDSARNLISVTLVMAETEGVPRAEVSGQWYIRKVRT